MWCSSAPAPRARAGRPGASPRRRAGRASAPTNCSKSASAPSRPSWSGAAGNGFGTKRARCWPESPGSGWWWIAAAASSSEPATCASSGRSGRCTGSAHRFGPWRNGWPGRRTAAGGRRSRARTPPGKRPSCWSVGRLSTGKRPTATSGAPPLGASPGTRRRTACGGRTSAPVSPSPWRERPRARRKPRSPPPARTRGRPI